MRIGKREGDIENALVFRSCRRLSVQGNGGLSPAIAHDFDISHAHAVYENTRAKRLAYRLFGREARSVMRCGIRLGLAIGALDLGENLRGKRGRTLHHATHARDFYDINTKADRHKHSFRLFAIVLQTKGATCENRRKVPP